MSKLSEIYDKLPTTSKALWRHIKNHVCDLLSPDVALINDLGHPNDFRVVDASGELGIIMYRGGRKLCCHGLIKASAPLPLESFNHDAEHLDVAHELLEAHKDAGLQKIEQAIERNSHVHPGLRPVVNALIDMVDGR